MVLHVTGFCAQCRISNRWSWIIMLMVTGSIFRTSNIPQLVYGKSAHLSTQGAFVCFVVHIVCQVYDVIAYYSLVLYLQFCSTLTTNFFYRAAYLVVLKICKLLVTCVGHAQVQMVADACQTPDAPPGTTASAVSPAVHKHAVLLQQALLHVPNPNAECMTRNVASKIGQHLGKQVRIGIRITISFDPHKQYTLTQYLNMIIG